MLCKGPNVLGKLRYKFPSHDSTNNMAANAESAKIRAGQRTKIPVLKKSKRINPKEMSPVLPITLGSSSCSKCEAINKENMIECKLCVRWFHHSCEFLELFHLDFLVKNQDKIPYACTECCSLMDSCFGKVLRECHRNLKERVSQTEQNIALVDSRLKALEQLNKYEENLDFHKELDKKLEACISNMNSDIKEMEKKIEMVSETNKSESHESCDRKKRIVIFGMPNYDDDLEAVQDLIKFLEIEEIKIKKIFRINSKTSDDRWAPPLNIEFYSMKDKFKLFNRDIRYKLKYECSGHIYENVKIAPDRSFKERQKYKQLRDEMDKRNEDLMYSGIADQMWIIRRMSLEKVQVEYYDD